MAAATAVTQELKLPRFRRDMFDNTATPEETEQAYRRIEEALSLAGLSASKFVHQMFLYFNHQIPATHCGDGPNNTMAVATFADGDKVFMYNPSFVNSLETSRDVLFICYHEALHWLLAHMVRRPELRRDKQWTYACEIVINATVLSRFNTGRMPHAKRINKAGNEVAEPTGIDPRQVHKEYSKQLTEAGLTPVSYDKFTGDEHTCYTELCRMPNPPDQSQGTMKMVCPHQDGDGDGDGSGAPGDLDQEAVDEVVRQAIQATMTEARRGSERAREELLALAEMTEEGNEAAQKLWGSYGLMGLRGKTDATRKVEWWQQWLINTIATKLIEGEKLIFPKKRSGMYLVLGMDPTPVRRGLETQTRMAVFIDRSASMSTKVTEDLNRLVGQIQNAHVDWFDFDGIVQRHVPGEGVHGGGGTNFQNCVDVAEGRLPVNGEVIDDEYDAIIMVTDGHAAHVTPAEPDRWIWLITQGGDEWPDSHDPLMDCHVIDTDAAVSQG